MSENIARGTSKPEVPRDPVAQRVLAVLEACADTNRPVTITQIVQETGLAKSTVHRICWHLVELGVLERASEGFSIGTKMMAIGSSSPVIKKLRSVAIPYLVELQQAVGASQLAVLVGNKSLVVDGLYTKDLRAFTLVGVGMPLHCTATGKAILALLDEEQQDLLLGEGPLPRATRWTITQPAQLKKYLHQVAESGVAISDEEFQKGISAVAAAFRIGDDMYAAVGSIGQTSSPAVHGSAPLVLSAARELGQRFL